MLQKLGAMYNHSVTLAHKHVVSKLPRFVAGNKRGSVGNAIGYLIGGIILFYLAASLLPDVLSAWAGMLANPNVTGGVKAMLVIVPLAFVIGLLYGILRWAGVVGGGKKKGGM